MTPELKPCPFCGGDRLSVQTHNVQPEDYHGGYVCCLDCDAQGSDGITIDGWLSNASDARLAAVTAWNTRKAAS